MTDPLAPLRARFSERCRTDLERLRTLRQGSEAGPEMMTLVHNLAGAAGIFGYPSLSATAAALDDGFVSGRGPEANLLDMLEAQLAALADQSSSSLR